MSNELKATPGPWEVLVEQVVPTSNATCLTVVTDDFDIVSPRMGIRKEADANLIAAAPDLYAALDDLLYYSDDMSSPRLYFGAVEAAKAALAKARGEQS